MKAGEPPLLSPHARGWTVRGRSPAHRRIDCPRTRGGGPLHITEEETEQKLSPHAREWTGSAIHGIGGREIVPARAGVDRWAWAAQNTCSYCPRTRGGGPILFSALWRLMPLSSRARALTGALGQPQEPQARSWLTLRRVVLCRGLKGVNSIGKNQIVDSTGLSGEHSLSFRQHPPFSQPAALSGCASPPLRAGTESCA